MPKRRFQRGSFQVQNGKAYTLFYEDVERPDGMMASRRARHLIGDLNVLSRRGALREHELFMREINKHRGSVPAPIRGETFQDAFEAWKKDVAPNLSPATVRQRGQMRHADVRTTLKIYAHVIPQAQRESMERIAKRAIGTNVPIGTRKKG